MTIGITKFESFGKFKNFSSSTPIEFGHLTLIYSPNAGGKSTGSTMLRSVGANLPGLMTGRHKLGTKNPIEVGLTIDGTKKVTFKNGEWSHAIPGIDVFDDRYIADNVFAGLVVSGQQRYNLLELFLAEKVIKFNQQLAECNANLKKLQDQLLEFNHKIPMVARPGLTVEEFVKISPESELDQPSTKDISVIESTDSEVSPSHNTQQEVMRNRRNPHYSRLCKDYLKTASEILNTEKQMERVRRKIIVLKQRELPKYYKRINEILEDVSADFKIVAVEDEKSVAANHIDYYLQINKQNIPIDADEGNHQFENTLSAGDRNTLAMTFFIAKLEVDGNLKNKIIVFDDPIASLDTNRVHFLQNAIARLAPKVKAIIIFSHSKPYLRGIYRACQEINNKVGYELKRSTNNETIFCKWDVKRDLILDFNRWVNRIENFVADGSSEDKNQVSLDLRMVLETYCQVHFSRDFTGGNLLGGFFDTLKKKIRVEKRKIKRANGKKKNNEKVSNEVIIKTPVPISESKVELLGELIRYANPFHHSVRDTIDGKDIDEQELNTNCKKLLKFMDLFDENAAA